MCVVCVRSRSVIALNGGLVSRLRRDCCGGRLFMLRSLYCGGCAVSRIVGIVTAKLQSATRQWFRNNENPIQIREEILLEILRLGHGADGSVNWREKQWREKQFKTGETNGCRRDRGLVTRRLSKCVGNREDESSTERRREEKRRTCRGLHTQSSVVKRYPAWLHSTTLEANN